MKSYLAPIVLLLVVTGSASAQDGKTPAPGTAKTGDIAVLPTLVCPPPASLVHEGLVPTTGPCAAFPICCPPASRCWASAEFLVWWIEDANLPPVASTSAALGDPRRGAIDLPSTTVLYGGRDVDFNDLTGGRLTLGGWLDDERTWGVEASGFVLEKESTGFSAGSLQIGSAPLFIPAFRAEQGVEGSLIISDPTFPAAGVLDIDLDTQLWGAELNVLRNVSRDSNFSIDMLVGFRHLNLAENFILHALIVGDGPFSVAAADYFGTENQFYGGQIGARARWQRGRFGVDVTGKLALGNTHQVVQVNGVISQSGAFAAANGQLGTFPGGVFSQPSNIGLRSHNNFSVIPEVQVRLNYQATDRLCAFVSYNFLFWSDVVRPGDQIDRSVNKTQQGGGVLVGPASPAPRFEDTGFWAQGIGLGLEYRY